MWDEAGVPRKNPGKHGENMQRHVKEPGLVVELNFLFWGNSAHHRASVEPSS